MLAALLLALALAPAQAQPLFAPVQRRIEYQDIATGQFGVNDGQTSSCEKSLPPEPTDTPNPLVSESGKVVVDMVVGWDGKVYSAFVLETNIKNLRPIELAMKSWRFRPATCNGTPVTVEARVTFVKK